MSESPIQGVFAALVTPFDESRAIDAKALDHLIDYLAGREIHGFALLTEAAEDVMLSADERRTLLKNISARLKGRKKILVMVSSPATNEATDLVRFAEGKGASGILLAPTRVPGIGYRELYRYLDRIVRATALPVLLVARPGNALKSLLPEEVTTLISHAGLKGIVAPQAAPSAIEGWAKRFKGREASILGGCSLALSRAMKAGANGVVCALATVASEQAATAWKSFAAEDHARVAQIEALTAPVVEMMGPPIVTEAKDGVQKLATKIAKRSLEGPVIAPSYPFALIKETLRLQGHPIRADVRPPYEPVRPDFTERLKATLQEGGLLA